MYTHYAYRYMMIYVYMYTQNRCIYIYISLYSINTQYRHIYIYVNVYVYVYGYVYVYMHTHTHTYVHMIDVFVTFSGRSNSVWMAPCRFRLWHSMRVAFWNRLVWKSLCTNSCLRQLLSNLRFTNPFPRFILNTPKKKPWWMG